MPPIRLVSVILLFLFLVVDVPVLWAKEKQVPEDLEALIAQAVTNNPEVKASAERWQMRQIVSSSIGQLLLTHFGLGDATQVDVLRIEWPSGTVQQFTDVVAGQIVTVKPDHLLMHDNASAIFGKVAEALGTYGIANRQMPVIVLDHVIPAASEKDAAGHKKIRQFVERYQLPHFFAYGATEVAIEKEIAGEIFAIGI